MLQLEKLIFVTAYLCLLTWLSSFADVMAFVKEIGELEEYGRDDVKKNKLRLVLMDNMLVNYSSLFRFIHFKMECSFSSLLYTFYPASLILSVSFGMSALRKLTPTI